ncbi:MAG: hypothetical protein MUE30_08220 [Spirosomaceae bacterium]|jgi:hypothetical protein|nr:hypothetical protein [Spirosomataceae bacterium]
MKTVSLLLFCIGIFWGCSSKDADLLAENLRTCASARPELTGKWVLTEFRYYGGCCPVIADSTWKKADTSPEARAVIEFTTDGNLRVYPIAKNSNVQGNFSASFAPNLPIVTSFKADTKEITLAEQILGGGPWYKIVKIKQLSTTELTLAILVGKEGEMNDRKYLRICE